MRSGRWALAVLVGIVGCGGGSDTDGPHGADIRGRYNVIVAGTNGCLTDEGASRAELITTWANGPLAIDGDPDGAMTYDFTNGTTMSGGVDEFGAFNAGGTVTEVEGWTLDAIMVGDAALDGDQWVLTGEFSATANDDDIASNDCTIEAPFSAYLVAQ